MTLNDLKHTLGIFYNNNSVYFLISDGGMEFFHISTNNIVFVSASSLLNVFVLLKCPNSIKRYNICMGREENYNYNLENFYEVTSAGPIANFPLSNPYK